VNIVRQIGPHTNNRSRQVVKLAEECLQQSAHDSFRMITCHFEDGVLTLRGKLPSFYLKQLAQEAVREVHRVRRVINEIEVTPD